LWDFPVRMTGWRPRFDWEQGRPEAGGKVIDDVGSAGGWPEGGSARLAKAGRGTGPPVDAHKRAAWCWAGWLGG